MKALQAAFDPSVLEFSDEYYDTLGLENPGTRRNRTSTLAVMWPPHRSS
ncbi:MAG: hypothetical protein ACLTYN_05850 [Dysosmobacter welbionis]